MLSQRGERNGKFSNFQFIQCWNFQLIGKPLLVHDGFSFGIQYIRKDKKYWQCNLSRKFNCKARVTTTDSGEIIVTNNEHCHTEIRQHLKKEYKMNKLHNQLNNHYMGFGRSDRATSMPYIPGMGLVPTSTLTSSSPSIQTTTTSIMPRQVTLSSITNNNNNNNNNSNHMPRNYSMQRQRSRSSSITPPPPDHSPDTQ
jgi:hypothetical protein